MKNICAWVQGKPPLLAVYALNCVSGIHDVEEMLGGLPNRQLYRQKIPTAPFDDWRALYRKPLAVQVFFAELAKEFSSSGEDGVLVIAALLRFGRDLKRHGIERLRNQYFNLPDEERNELHKFWQTTLSNLLESVLTEIEDEFAGVQMSEEARDKFANDFWLRPESSFFLLVWLPSLLLHRTDVHVLYKRACQGDFEALKILVRLDPSIMSDQKIGNMIYNQSLGQRHRLANIYEVAKGERIDKIGTQKNIVRAAAVISLASDIFRHPLTCPEIRDLFDAFAIDSGRGEQEDALPADPQTFYTAMTREKKLWLKACLPQQDKDKK